MTPQVKMLVVLLCSPFMLVAVHAGLSRVLRGSLPQVVVVKAAVAGYVPMAFCLCVFVFPYVPSARDLLLFSVYGFIVYTSCAYTYFHLFNMSETARRIRIIHEVYLAGSLTSEGIKALYKTSDIIGIRLKRLVAMKKLKYAGGYYTINGRLLYWAAAGVAAWRKVLGFQGNRDSAQ